MFLQEASKEFISAFLSAFPGEPRPWEHKTPNYAYIASEATNALDAPFRLTHIDFTPEGIPVPRQPHEQHQDLEALINRVKELKKQHSANPDNMVEQLLQSMSKYDPYSYNMIYRQKKLNKITACLGGL